jgi:hypothetical protein
MGLADRDYMNERRPEVQRWERPSRETSLRSTLWIILTWVSVLFLLYKSFLWWGPQKTAVIAIHPSIEVTVPQAAVVEQRQIILPPTPQPVQLGSDARLAPVHPGDRIVTKCVVNGKVIFMDRDCPTGAMESSVTVNTANVGTVVPHTIAPPPQVQHRNVVTTTTTYSTNDVTSKAATRDAECTSLDIRIKQIDSQARQPQSGQTQDALSAERARHRSRQYELHC